MNAPVKWFLVIGFLPIVLFVNASTLFAGADIEAACFDREFTFGIAVSRHDFGGSFNGGVRAINGPSVLAIPKIDPAVGIGLSMAIKNRVGRSLGVELAGGFSFAHHDARWSDQVSQADSLHLDLDMAVFLNAQRKAQPFLLGGFSLSSLSVRDGYESPTWTSDAKFSGRGSHVGAGVRYYFTPSLSLTASALRRWLTFYDVDSGQRSQLNPDLKSTSTDFALTLARHFDIDASR